MDNNIKFAYFFVIAAVVAVAPEALLADETGGLQGSVGAGLCDIVTALKGKVGKGIATLAVLFLGIGAFFGKVNWGLAVMVGVGIAAIFGATEIVEVVGGDAEGC